MINRGKLAAIKLRSDIGICHPDEIPLEDVIIGRGGLVKYLPMGKTDGRIVHGKRLSTVYINSEISHEGRIQFALAHELGHLEMHRDILLHDDKVSLDWFRETKSHLAKGVHEFEANQFAAEYLMPSQLFHDEAKGRKLSPELIHHLVNRFRTSYTSTAFKYFEANLYPMAIFHIFNGVVKYWKKSEDMYGRIKNITNLPPPSDSVANEYITEGYAPLYQRNELMQSIFKSVWFDLDNSVDDTECYEYCIVSQSHKSILSIIWEP